MFLFYVILFSIVLFPSSVLFSVVAIGYLSLFDRRVMQVKLLSSLSFRGGRRDAVLVVRRDSRDIPGQRPWFHSVRCCPRTQLSGISGAQSDSHVWLKFTFLKCVRARRGELSGAVAAGARRRLGYEHSERPSKQAKTNVAPVKARFGESEKDGAPSAQPRWSLPSIGFELPQLTVSRVLVRNTCRR